MSLNCVIFSNDDKMIISAGEDSKINAYSIESKSKYFSLDS